VTAEQAVIEYFAESAADLREQVVALQELVSLLDADLRFAVEDSATWRDSAQEVLRLLHDEREAHNRLKQSHHRVLDQYRALREHEMRQAA
jgi:hypothetical protein